MCSRIFAHRCFQLPERPPNLPHLLSKAPVQHPPLSSPENAMGARIQLGPAASLLHYQRLSAACTGHHMANAAVSDLKAADISMYMVRGPAVAALLGTCHQPPDFDFCRSREVKVQ